MAESPKDKLYEQFTFRVPIGLKQEFAEAVVHKKTKGARVLREFMQRYVNEAKTPLVH